MNQSIHQGDLFAKGMSAEHTSAAGQQSRIVAFDFESHDVRVQVDELGQPWFNAADVCAALELSNPRDALSKHVDSDDVAKRDIIDTLGRVQHANHVNESGLYALILGSTKDAAKRFKRWVTREVLPSIRKTGSYATTDPMQILNDPAAMRGLLLTYTEKVLALESRVVNLEPKAEALDRIADADGMMNPTVAAKALQVPPRRLFDFLREHRWIYRRPGGNNVAYQDKIQAGYLTHKVTTILRDDGTEKMVEQVLVTGKGLTKLAQSFGMH